MSIEFDGFDDLAKNIEQYGKELEALDGEHHYTLDDLFTDSFMKRHTNFETLQQMADASGIQSVEEINSPEWSAFVASNTRFSGWSEMHQTGLSEWISKKAGL